MNKKGRPEAKQLGIELCEQPATPRSSLILPAPLNSLLFLPDRLVSGRLAAHHALLGDGDATDKT
jgi:hypothetical protein